MFDLMTDPGRLPLKEEEVVQIHKGMSPLRVSVGEHVSQTSEVYIVTGQKDDFYQTFIVFFMIEPEIQVVYGFEENPYDPSKKEEILGGAFQFVEEMGGIMEEVPWEDMSAQDRVNWIVESKLFPVESQGEKDILDNLEEIQLGDIIEVLEEEDGGDSEETLEFEVEGEEESDVPSVPEEPAEKRHGDDQIQEETGADDQDQEHDEDGDFDKLLKQAFLKPELIRKSSAKKSGVGEKTRPESPALEEPDETPYEQDSFGSVEGEVAEAAEDVEAEFPTEEDLDASLHERVSEKDAGLTVAASEENLRVEKIQIPDPEESKYRMVLRFLSRF